MPDIPHAEILRHPDDASLLADSADLGDVGLNDVESPPTEKGHEALSPGEHLSTGDRHRAREPQVTVIVDGVWLQGFLEPAYIVVLQHVRRAQRPFEAMRPVGIAGTSIDEELRVRPDAVSGRPHDGFVQPGIIGPAEWSPADLEGPETSRMEIRNDITHLVRLFHQQGAVRLDLPPIVSPQKLADRKPGCLAKDVPHGNVDAADGVGQRSATSHPERVLVQLFRRTLRFQRVFADQKWLEHLQPRLRQASIGEDAAVARDPGIGVNSDQGMDGIFRANFGGPPAFRAFAEQWRGRDPCDAHLAKSLHAAHGCPPCWRAFRRASWIAS